MIDLLNELAELEEERSQLRSALTDSRFRLEATNIQRVLTDKHLKSNKYKELLNAARAHRKVAKLSR